MQQGQAEKGVFLSSVWFRVIEQSQTRPCGDERGTLPYILPLHFIV